jgi:acyl-CoA synthetase (AMP-forming)/AMP-acid ligase II/acyl carrier protein
MPIERSSGTKRPVPFLLLPHMLEHQAKRIPDAPAILAPGRVPLSYGRLHQHVGEIEEKLRAMGIARHDRVVVVLPNGPDMAVAFLAVAASAVCAPMNPAFGAEELDRYFADLRPRALITLAGTDSPARRVALAHGVRLIGLSPAIEGPAGLFTLDGEHGPASPHEPTDPGNVALLLPTSGTTSRPKIVPLTHANICSSAYASVAALALGEADRCLNVLPLYYGHGLVATILASLAAGASVVCTPGCDVTRYFAWLAAFRPTWCVAVPTMLQAILAQARLDGGRVADGPLRFVRTASAPLPRTVFTELEQVFAAPVINFYGMTETASAPIAINPLPPRRRKVGSVGVPVALNVAIMDDRGTLLSGGQTGQIVVRGASVTAGYDGNPRATEAAFAGDWFRTGDQGFFDDDGYLFLVGRSQEIINRGGDKIAPQEVDDVLLEHPAIAEAVTFAVPHPTLGEDVASAIVLRLHAAATPKDIRQFALGRLAAFKVPRQVLIVRDIPKGPTGKLQRIGLAAKLGLASDAAATPVFVTPRTPIEQALAAIWAEVLQAEQVGAHDDFFALGGDSLQATRVLVRLRDTMHVDVDASRLFAAPTVAEMAEHIATLIPAGQAPPSRSAVVRVPRENGVMPASVSQERLWKLQRALPDMPFFNILHALRSTSDVNAALLERSINEIVRRHEILRTTFATVDGRCVQVIAPQSAVPLGFDDLRTLPPSSKDTVAYRIVQDEAGHVFDLANGPLIRARLVRLAEHEHLLLVSMHQVVCDGWSLGVFVEELAALYDGFSGGQQSPLAPLPLQYADFAQWQRNWKSNPDIVAQHDYWRAQLGDPLSAIQLAPSRPRRAIDDLHTARRAVALPVGLAEAAKRLGHEEGATLFMALVAALKTLLHRVLGQDDVRVATNVANRDCPGTEALIGHLVNTVILRTDLGGDPSPREVMRRVRTTTLAALANAAFPFEELVQTLGRERNLKSMALANVMILLHNAMLRPTINRGYSLKLEEANPDMLVPLMTLTSFDFILMLKESSRGLVGTCVYKPNFLDASMIDDLLRKFQEVLERMTLRPDRPISEICD